MSQVVNFLKRTDIATVLSNIGSNSLIKDVIYKQSKNISMPVAKPTNIGGICKNSEILEHYNTLLSQKEPVN